MRIPCGLDKKGVGNVMDVMGRVQLTGLGMFGTFTGYRMKPRGFGVSRYPHASVWHTGLLC